LPRRRRGRGIDTACHQPHKIAMTYAIQHARRRGARAFARLRWRTFAGSSPSAAL